MNKRFFSFISFHIFRQVKTENRLWNITSRSFEWQSLELEVKLRSLIKDTWFLTATNKSLKTEKPPEPGHQLCHYPNLADSDSRDVQTKNAPNRIFKIRLLIRWQYKQ